jgi:hypothetical protein
MQASDASDLLFLAAGLIAHFRMNETLTAESPHGELTLAEIEQRLRAEGYSSKEVDTTLAFVVTIREELARAGKRPEHSQRPS